MDPMLTWVLVHQEVLQKRLWRREDFEDFGSQLAEFRRPNPPRSLWDDFRRLLGREVVRKRWSQFGAGRLTDEPRL